MSLAIVYTRAQVGIHAPLVSVEVHLSGGLPGLFIVGLPEAAVKESKDRVRGAILNSQFEFPSRRITINLAPADLPKEGGRFDLPIALGILAASGQINRERLNQHEFLGELALGGELRGVRGVLPAALACRDAKRTLLVPYDNTGEATLVGDVDVLGATHLLEVCRQLATGAALQPPPAQSHPTPKPILERDLSDVRGQHHAKRALEIAAAGG
ncbi:MAG TPA: magnesium chelatase domain-containing protein, partial [Candidatus Competibacter sp.]|nr:magnesium chelatase domain-containing protein [Candidatus Competibacter sp.]